IKGGSSVFSDYLGKVITDNGGKVTLKHKVIGLNIKGNEIDSLDYVKTRSDDAFIREKAKYYVVNAAIPYVYQNLLKNYDDKYEVIKSVKGFGTSFAASTYYYGLKEPLQNVGANAYLNIFM